MADHDHLVIQAIARRAFELHESAGLHHGRDHHDWFQAEQELTALDSQLNLEADGLAFMVQIPVEAENRTQIFASVSPWSILLLTVPDASTVDACCQSDLQDLIRYVSLPREVIPGGLTLPAGQPMWISISAEPSSCEWLWDRGSSADNGISASGFSGNNGFSRWTQLKDSLAFALYGWNFGAVPR